MNKHTAALLEKHFDVAFAAPDGVKKLRELILTLAMQGKLIPQDPNDAPASELLKEIEAEKRRLVKQGKIKPPKPLPPITEEEKPYVLPLGWEWVRLNSLGYFMGGKTPSTNDDSLWGGGIPWVSPKDMKVWEISSSEDTVSEQGVRSGLSLIPKDSILMVVRSGILRRAFPVAINKVQCTVNQDLKALVPFSQKQTRFLFQMFRGLETYILNKFTKKGVTVESVIFDEFSNAVFPLPPFAEQNRIVAKIDELMTRCDELEKLRTTQQEKRLTVHTAAIKQLLNIAEPDQHQRAQTFLAEHFNELYTVKENVAELRKAILQLAVMGKLVPQNPNDPPASELLKKIEAEKQRLVKAGKIKSPKPLPPITEEEKPYALPLGWEWVRLENISQKIHYGYTASADHDIRNIRLLRITDIQENKVDWETVPGCDASANEVAQYLLADNDILIARTGGTVGKSFLVQGVSVDAVFASYLIRVIPSNLVCVRYIKYFLESPLYWKQLYAACSGTGQPNVNGTSLSQLLLTLPPYFEQQRIVAKIDELIMLCDTLEQTIGDATKQQTDLLNTLI